MKPKNQIKTRIIVAFVICILLLISFDSLVVQTAKAQIWPPETSPDMRRKEDNKLIRDWGHQAAYYSVWKDINSYKWVGMTRTMWKSGGLDYHSSIIKVVRAGGTLAPGGTAPAYNDPYGYLPRNGQNYEYNSNDADRVRDKLGWVSTSLWVALPATVVPATWYKYGSEQNGVVLAFVTDPNCWKPGWFGNKEPRQGITYDAGTYGPQNYYMDFIVYYESRDTGWFGNCYGGTFYDSGSASYKL